MAFYLVVINKLNRKKSDNNKRLITLTMITLRDLLNLSVHLEIGSDVAGDQEVVELLIGCRLVVVHGLSSMTLLLIVCSFQIFICILILTLRLHAIFNGKKINIEH